MPLLRIYLFGLVLGAVTACSHRYESGSLSSISGLSFSPAGGPVGGGNTLTLSGTDFPPGATVTVGGVDCPVLASGSGVLTCTVPAGALGWVNIILNLKGQGSVTLATLYAYGAAVIGQPTSVSNTLLYGNSLTAPESAVVAGTSLFVADSQAGRIALFSPVPSASAANPTGVLGQIDLSGGQVAFASNTNPYGLTMGSPRAMCTDGTRFLVVDSGRNRILVYKTIPTLYSSAPSFVLGQSDFVGQLPNKGSTALDGTTLNSPQGIYCDSTYVMVADTGNHRVLIWNVAITANDQAANLVLGQPDFVSGLANQGLSVSAATLNSPKGILLSGGSLYVSDSGNQRVLIWTAVPTVSDQAAILALGPSSLTSGNGGGCVQTGLSSPAGIAQAGNFVYVADAAQHRILGWDVSGGLGAFSNGQASSLVLGQTLFTTCSANQGSTTASASTLRGPTGLFSSGTNLYVSDTGNNRVLIYNVAPTASTAAADLFLGQPSAGGVNPAYALVNASTLRAPQSAAVFAGSLYVADSILNRVLVFNPVPTVGGSSASLVLGQPDMNTAVSNLVSGVASAQTLLSPKGVYTDLSANLYVSDSGNNRVIMYSGLPGGNDPSATVALGQSSLSATSGATTATGARSVGPICLANGQLLAADAGNNRVLVYDAWNPAGGSGQAATYVLGQLDMNSKSANQGGLSPSATTLSNPSSVTCDVNHLVVTDQGNQRVLIYNLPITGNTPSAVTVLGQSDFASYLPNRGTVSPTGATLYNPRGAVIDGSRLYIADAHNHRILIWNTFPTANGQYADSVFGQTSTAGFFPNQGASTPTLTSLNSPAGLSVSGGRLVISDSGNARVILVPSNGL